MHPSKRVVARGNTGDRPAFHDSSPRSAAVVQAEKTSAVEHDDLRGERRGGRRLSAQVGAADVLGGPTSQDFGAGKAGRQNRLLDRPPVSAVPYGRLKDLARARVRRVVRKMDFDWERFLAGDPEWSLTEAVHRKAVQAAAGGGLEVRPTDVPTDAVLKAVRAVLGEMDANPALRPSEAGYRAEQARRGELGRIKQAEEAREREAAVMKLVASGVTKNTEIADVVGVRPSTVGRILKRVAERERVAEQFEALKWVFPAEDVPAGEHWPAVQFVKQTGVYLDEDQTRWICDIGRCYEAEGREGDLMDHIQMSAGARDPWAYLQRCVGNRGDTWTVMPQLLADVLVWAGEKSLVYSLMAIGCGSVKRPLPYLREVLAKAVRKDQGRSRSWERPVAMSVGMARQLAPELVIVNANDAIAGEAVEERNGHLESYRQRFGRMPWETEPVLENAADMDASDAENCCIGLKGVWSDDSNSQNLDHRCIDSSGTIKANATPAQREKQGLERTVPSPDQPDEVLVAVHGGILGGPLWERKKLEQLPKTTEVPESDEIRRSHSHGEPRKPVKVTTDPLPAEKNPPVLEQVPCRHPLADLLTAGMVLDDIVEVDCAAGCGHRLYSDRGPVECPCHWPAAKVAQVARALRLYKNPRLPETVTNLCQ